MGFLSTKSHSPVQQRKRIGEAVTRHLDVNPAITRVESDAAQIYYCPNYLDADRCAALIAVIDANRRPSTLLSSTYDSAFRTSESCDMDRWAPNIRPVDEGLARLLGVEPEYGETMQGQRYAPGQHIRAHTDNFHKTK